MLTFYHHPNCGTCKKAIAWLNERGVAHELIDIRETPPPAGTLRRALAGGVALRGLFNTSGQVYRDGGYKDKLAGMSEAEALAALSADGMLVKRPIATDGARVTVGFKAEAYAEAWGR